MVKHIMTDSPIFSPVSLTGQNSMIRSRLDFCPPSKTNLVKNQPSTLLTTDIVHISNWKLSPGFELWALGAKPTKPFFLSFLVSR